MHDAFATKLEQFQPCEYTTCSFFDLIDSIWKGPEESSYALHRFCTLMRKMNAKSFLQEELILNQELLEEKAMAEEYFDGEVKLDATRLTFFCGQLDLSEWDTHKENFEKYILGYAVIVTMVMSDNSSNTYLLEAIVRPPSIILFDENKDAFIEPVTNYYIHNVKKFLTTIGTEESPKHLSIEGSFFCQQNTFTSVCAHAALRTAINSSPLLNAPKLTNKRINDILKEKVKDELRVELKDLRKGLDQERIQAVVEELGYEFHSANFSENTQIEYDQFIYPSLESCFPVILGIQGYNTSHVVSVLGHTINSDRWSPEAKCGYGNYPIQYYFPSASWCDHFIISDDNYGMFGTLPSDMIRNFIVPTKNPNLHVSMAVSILPRGVVLRGYEAEQWAIVIAQNLVNVVEFTPKNKWHERLKKNKDGKHKDLVLRTLLQTKEQYLSFIHDNTSTLTASQQKCLDNLPKYVWVTEVSLPNIYTGNKHKLGDVVFRANASSDEHKNGRSLALAWFPGFIQIGSTPQVEVWSIKTHVPLIRNTESSFLEW